MKDGVYGVWLPIFIGIIYSRLPQPIATDACLPS